MTSHLIPMTSHILSFEIQGDLARITAGRFSKMDVFSRKKQVLGMNCSICSDLIGLCVFQKGRSVGPVLDGVKNFQDAIGFPCRIVVTFLGSGIPIHKPACSAGTTGGCQRPNVCKS